MYSKCKMEDEEIQKCTWFVSEPSLKNNSETLKNCLFKATNRICSKLRNHFRRTYSASNCYYYSINGSVNILQH